MKLKLKRNKKTNIQDKQRNQKQQQTNKQNNYDNLPS